VVTGLGSVDVLTPREGAQLSIDEAPDLPHVPELPQRGPWAEPAGRLAAVLVDLPLELEVGRWRLASRPGRDLRRAAALLGEDLDAVEEQWAGYEGTAKLQLLGPLSAAAMIELPNGDAAVSDPAALGDLTASLVEGLVAHLADLRRRVEGARWVVQIDERLAAAVIEGSVARPSGWGAHPAVPIGEASTHLRALVDAAHGVDADVALHSCGDPDWALLTETGADAVSVPASVLVPEGGEWTSRLAQWWDDGRAVWVASDRSSSQGTSHGTTLDAIRRLQAVLAVDPDDLEGQLVLTPACAWGSSAQLTAGAAPVGAREYADVRALWRLIADA
jgi:hypothetical protein